MGTEQFPAGIRVKRGRIELRFQATDWNTGQRKRFEERLTWAPTERNIRQAAHLLTEVKADDRLGLLTPERYVMHFPQTRLVDIELPPEAENPLFQEQAQRYLDTFGPAQEKGTRAEYLKTLNGLWLPHFYDRRVKSIRASEVEQILAKADFKAVRTRNNALTPLRGLFRLLEKDRILKSEDNPLRQIEWQRPPKMSAETINPLSIDEMHLVLDWMDSNAHPIYAAYFRLAFASGMRNPSELTALWWDCIDFRKGTLRVKRKLTRQNLYNTTKTGDIRDVALPDMGIQALEAMKMHTFLQGGYVFRTPNNNTMKSPTKTLNPLWNQCFKKLGIRHRDMRQTRHTTATHWIMAGANVKWIANQLGHDVATLEKHYAKWLDEQGTQAELDKINEYQNSLGRTVFGDKVGTDHH